MIICHWEWIWLKEIMPKPLTQIMYQLLLIIFCQTALYFILFIPLACPLPLYLVVYLVPGFYKDTGGKNQWISWNCFCFRLKPCKPARTCKHFPSSKSRHSPFSPMNIHSIHSNGLPQPTKASVSKINTHLKEVHKTLIPIHTRRTHGKGREQCARSWEY